MRDLNYYRENGFKVTKHPSKELYLINNTNHTGNFVPDGLVLNRQSKVITRPYAPFNELENVSKLDGKEFSIREKLDGTLIAVSRVDEGLMYSTKYAFTGGVLHQVKSWVDKNMSKKQKRKLKDLTTNYTILFEFISPNHMNKVKYAREDLVLHGAIMTKTGKEIINPIILKRLAQEIGVDVPSIFQIPLSRMMEIKKQNLKDNVFEGFVVTCTTGDRYKITMDDFTNYEKGSV